MALDVRTFLGVLARLMCDFTGRKVHKDIDIIPVLRISTAYPTFNINNTCTKKAMLQTTGW